MSKRQRRQYDDEQHQSFFLRDLHAKTPSQEFYLSTLREATITLCTGPAGTGKTYLASYVALEMLQRGDVDKIILCRPLVATEDIGYLPGTLQEKIHPYIMPLVDSIECHVGATKTTDFFHNFQLEALPLAYMRGRSLNRVVAILDEAQNTTREQMFMFLTRIGYGTKLIINGDVTQSDLPKPTENGLAWVVDRLRGVDKNIALVEFGKGDVVRNPLIEVMASHLGR